MTHRARAYWTVAREEGELREELLPERGAGQALVRTSYSAISRGTELLVHRGRVPVSEYERMRAPHQAGAFPFPVKYGYANVGRVLEGTPALRGRDVFCLYPHQDSYVVDEAQLAPLPPDVPPERAVLAANMETALNAIWDAELKPGARVAVIGAGVVGALFAYLAGRHPGTDVELIDVDPRREALAHALGVKFALPAAARANMDLVVHASGSPAGLERALELAAFEATVLELSWYGDARVTLPLGASFHSQRLRIQSSQVGSVAPALRARVDHRRRLQLALGLLNDPRLDALIDARAPFAELPQVMRSLAAGERNALCQRIEY